VKFIHNICIIEANVRLGKSGIGGKDGSTSMGEDGDIRYW
jgi:hypothetical protein